MILGNEIYLCRNGLNKDNFIKNKDRYYHFILLAKDEIGHEQIRELSTKAWLRSYTQKKIVRVPTYYSDIVEIVGANPGHIIASSACFLKGQMVRTLNGEKPIEQLNQNDYIMNYKGEWEKINFPTSRPYEGEGNKIIFCKEPIPISCTANHKFLVYDGLNLKWKEANFLKKGDKCVEPILKICYNNLKELEVLDIPIIKEYREKSKGQNYSNSIFRLPDKIIYTPELMRLFGLWLADGHISIDEKANRYSVGLTFSSKEFDEFYNTFVKSGLSDLGLHKNDYHIYKREKQHKVDLSINKVEMVLLFKYIFGLGHADTKKIPTSILHISKEFDMELFYGYMLGDGYFRYRSQYGGEMVAASISYTLIKDFEKLGNSLGLSGSITISKAKIDKNGVNHKQSYYLTYSNAYLGKNLSKVNVLSHLNLIKTFEMGKIKRKGFEDFVEIDNITYRIKKVKSNTSIKINEQVYCLNTPSHNFILNNIVVHNCLGGCLPTQLLIYRNSNDEQLYQKIINWCVQIEKIFGKGNFYLEMQPSNNKEQIYVNKELLKLSEKLEIPYIITTDSHYLKREDRPIHKAFLQSQDGDREVDEFYATTYLMETKEIVKYFSYLTEGQLQEAFNNIRKIRNMCKDYSLQKPLKIPRLKWKEPDYISTEEKENYFKKIPNLFKFYLSNYSEDKRLAEIIIDILKVSPYFNNEETYNEINLCLDDIWVSSEANKARWSAYLLNLQNIIDCCWDAGSLVGAGRGSGVGFLLLHILGITQINPLKEKTKTYRFRFLNPKRVSPLDIDIDIESSKRADVMKYFKKMYGETRVANVLTIRTEKSKSAILTAARGLGINNDVAQELSSMIESDRGQLRTLHQTAYGDVENGIPANNQFRKKMEEDYPELWKVARYIEGLVSGIGVHAGGVIFVDEDFTKSTALMRAPDGRIITQFDLHDSEAAGLIKYDILSINSLDKIHCCLDLLIKDKRIEEKENLKETYLNTLGVYKIERDDSEMWKMVWEHRISDLFQMEEQSGIQGIEILKPKSVDELSILNSTIRLMAQEKGGEMPTNKLARFKNNPADWDLELRQYGLGEKEKKILEPIVGISYGLCITQEQFMMLVQLPELGGFPLEFADRLRKSIAKKHPAEYEKVTQEFFKITKEKGCNEKLCVYVWNVLIAMSKGYGFNASHTLAYSIIGLQEMNLAYKYPTIYWDCACLISNVNSEENNNENEEEENSEYIYEDDDTNITEEDIEDFYEEEDEDIIQEVKKAQTKKKKKITKYGKIATAIGKMKNSGIKISLPDINNSSLTFSPNVEENTIRYGLSGITQVGSDLIELIIKNRPYSSLEDFLNKVKIKKPQVINLIKAGAFDRFNKREEVMKQYISSICGKKETLNLRNMQMLIRMKILPEKYDYEIRIFNYNKYLKKFKNEQYYLLNDIAFAFYEKYFDLDLLSPNESEEYKWKIVQKKWDNIYSKKMDTIRSYIKNNLESVLSEVNTSLYNEMWEKYCKGNLSKWEMDSISCYFHEHELQKVDQSLYGCTPFNKLPTEPQYDRTILIKGKEVELLKINRIMGTVLDKKIDKKTITLLTTSGVVTVKIFGQIFSYFNKQISEKGEDGKKHVIEKSIFSRGNKIIVTGIRRGDTFIAKKYARTPYHLIELITNIDGDKIKTYYREIEE